MTNKTSQRAPPELIQADFDSLGSANMTGFAVNIFWTPSSAELAGREEAALSL